MTRPKAPRFNVYLAGPISGCNDEQLHVWRRWVRDKATDFDVIDPTESLVDESATPYELVQSDLGAIERSDGVLVTMLPFEILTNDRLSHSSPRRPGRVVGQGHARDRSRDPLGCPWCVCDRERPDTEDHEPGVRGGVGRSTLADSMRRSMVAGKARVP